MAEKHGHMVHVPSHLGPRDHPVDKVWPKHRLHLLDPCYKHMLICTLISNGWSINDAILRIHCKTFYEHDLVLLCDVDHHLMVYLAEMIDIVETKQ